MANLNLNLYSIVSEAVANESFLEIIIEKLAYSLTYEMALLS